MPTTHRLPATRDTLHGHFSHNLAPITTIESGDTVEYTTLDAGWGLEPLQGGLYQHNSRREISDRPHGEHDNGHALTGPIFIRGAQPGMTLEILIKTIRPAAWGFCLAGGWPSSFNERLGVIGDGITHAWTLDRETMTGRNHLGHSVALRPFMGVMGMPPKEDGIHSTIPPRVWGGNMDCKELVEGSRLYLPIPVEGGLFSVGDGHAAQGDGEVSGNAIECPMEQVELTFNLREDFPVSGPVAYTPNGWLTMGFERDLNEATYTALESMLFLMQQFYGIDKRNALALASLGVDLRITQIVNEACGVHAILPHDRIRMEGV